MLTKEQEEFLTNLSDKLSNLNYPDKLALLYKVLIEDIDKDAELDKDYIKGIAKVAENFKISSKDIFSYEHFKYKNIFDKDYLKSIGYELVSDDGVYGKAESIRPKGKKILSWNREGTEINYFGEKIPFAYLVGIKDDGGTRTSFNGIVRTKEELKFLLESTC